MKYTFTIMSTVEEIVTLDADTEQEAWDGLDEGYQPDSTRTLSGPSRLLVKVGRKTLPNPKEQP